MKKIFAVLFLSLFFVGGCSCEPNLGSKDNVYRGMYSYEAYGTTYGAVVDVEIDKDTKKIIKVTLLPDSDEMTNLSEGWDGRDMWLEDEASVLASFAGLTLEEVMSISVFYIDDIPGGFLLNDVPLFVSVGEEDGETRATQSTTRVILAVQNAITESGIKLDTPSWIEIEE